MSVSVVRVRVQEKAAADEAAVALLALSCIARASPDCAQRVFANEWFSLDALVNSIWYVPVSHRALQEVLSD